MPFHRHLVDTRDWILEVTGPASPDARGERGVADPDLTVHDLAERFGRKPPTVRMWLEAGRFPNAYRFQGREWRVPVTDLDAFETQERERARAPQATGPAAPIVDLSVWRTVKR
ncbi:MAG: helix-turn-helix domain-containing protein [Gemmatimonadales bacterium]